MVTGRYGCHFGNDYYGHCLLEAEALGEIPPLGSATVARPCPVQLIRREIRVTPRHRQNPTCF